MDGSGAGSETFRIGGGESPRPGQARERVAAPSSHDLEDALLREAEARAKAGWRIAAIDYGAPREAPTEALVLFVRTPER